MSSLFNSRCCFCVPIVISTWPLVVFWFIFFVDRRRSAVDLRLQRLDSRIGEVIRMVGSPAIWLDGVLVVFTSSNAWHNGIIDPITSRANTKNRLSSRLADLDLRKHMLWRRPRQLWRLSRRIILWLFVDSSSSRCRLHIDNNSGSIHSSSRGIWCRQRHRWCCLLTFLLLHFWWYYRKTSETHDSFPDYGDE